MERKLVTAKVSIKGLSPLLMNVFKNEELTTSGRKNKQTLTKKEKAESAAYRNKDGHLYIPREVMWGCLTEAGRYVVYAGKKRISTKDSSLLPIGLRIIEEEILLNTDDFEVDERRCVVPSTKGAVMVCRPLIPEWEASFTLEIDLLQFSLETVKELIEQGGRVCGLMAYRPNKKGWFGTFELTKLSCDY